MKKNYSLKDIAKLAGVGMGTASRVLNNKPGVKEETREKVLKVMSELKYTPNSAARALKEHSSKMIGIIVKGLLNPFFAKVIESIEKNCVGNGYSIVFSYSEKLKIADSIDILLGKKVEGIICLGGNFDKSLENKIEKLEIPIILASSEINPEIKKNIFSSVIINNEGAVFEGVDYLCKLKHKKIGLIVEFGEQLGLNRMEGYKNALRANGINYDENLVENAAYTLKGGYDAMKKILQKSEIPTAVFATSDTMAMGAARAILESGYKIPEDISIMGFDGLEEGKYYYPSLSTIEQPREELGEVSTKLLIESIENHEIEKKHIIMPTKLIIRESVKKLD